MDSDRMNNTVNFSLTNKPDSHKHFDQNITFMLLYTFMALISLVSNGMVVIATYFITNRSCGTKICLHLSLSHLVAGSTILFLQAQGDRWLLQTKLCIPKLVMTSFWRVSVILLTFLATVESYVHTSRHLKRDQNSRTPHKDWTGVKITIIWLCSLAIGFFSFFLSFETGSAVCIAYQHTYKALVQIYYGFIFCFLITMFSINIFYIRLAKRQLQLQGVYQSSPPPEFNKVELRFSRCSFKLYHVIVLHWLPYLVYVFCLSSIGSKYKESDGGKSYHVLKACHLVTFLSTLLQPFVIVRYNEEYGVLMNNWDQMRRKFVRIKKTTPVALSRSQFELNSFNQVAYNTKDNEQKRSLGLRILATVDRTAADTNC